MHLIRCNPYRHTLPFDAVMQHASHTSLVQVTSSHAEDLGSIAFSETVLSPSRSCLRQGSSTPSEWRLLPVESSLEFVNTLVFLAYSLSDLIYRPLAHLHRTRYHVPQNGPKCHARFPSSYVCSMIFLFSHLSRTRC